MKRRRGSWCKINTCRPLTRVAFGPHHCPSKRQSGGRDKSNEADLEYFSQREFKTLHVGTKDERVAPSSMALLRTYQLASRTCMGEAQARRRLRLRFLTPHPRVTEARICTRLNAEKVKSRYD